MTGLIQQTIKRLQNQISEENDLLHTLKEETDNINLKMLHSLLAITIIGFPTLIIIGFFIPHFENLHLIYSPPWLICLCLRLWCRKSSSHKRILISMYALFAVFLMITLYISAIVAPESMASGPSRLFTTASRYYYGPFAAYQSVYAVILRCSYDFFLSL